MQRDRGILTLNNFKKNKKDDATNYTKDSRIQLAERQRILKEAQSKREQEKKQALLRQQMEKREKQQNENKIAKETSANSTNGGTNNSANNNANGNTSSNTNNNGFDKQDRFRNDRNDKNSKYNKFKDDKFRDDKFRDDKFKDDKFKDGKFRDFKDSKFNKDKDFKKNRNNDKNNIEKEKEENNKNSIAKAQADIVHQNNKFKENKNKNNNNNYDDEGNEKFNKKIVKDKSEKYSKNIHTFIFNDDDDGDELKRFYKSKRKSKKSNDAPQQKIFKTVNIPEFISIGDLADRMNEKRADLVKKLMTMGIKATINQTIDADIAELLVIEFGHTPNRVLDSDVESVLSEDEGKEFISRSPVVTVMGHVDHGKTSLLDAMRNTKVTESESGGITQHIGASRVECGDGKFITFIDTPGHEAFTEMRIRGANITDIVVLVVAADDGVKDQTIEAINHTKAAKAPMIVAINKIDKEGADPERVKQELLNYGVVAEEYGGDVMFVEVSAKNNINIDKLLDTILLQAEMLDLKAPIDCKARGAVIESKVDQKQGVVATVLVQAGILKIGDIILAGASYGKVKKMLDDKRKNQVKAGPSVAVEVLGFDTNPTAGDIFNVVSTDKEARDIVSYRERKIREVKEARRGKTRESLLQQVKGSNKKQLSIILKCDVSGSVDAITGSLMKLNNNDEVNLDIIHSAVGSITETDVNLASASNAVIIAFNVRGSSIVKDLAKEKDVKISYYSIIYNIIDDVKVMMSGLLKPMEKEKVLGQAEIRSIIRISGVGNVAGCYVVEGEIHRNANVRLVRDGIVIYDGKIKALRRFKDDVKEVKTNYECGISLENYDDIKEKDVIECYEIIEEKRSL